MIYRHRFTVRAALAEVAAFHSRAASMAAITPPPIVVRVHRAPETLGEGDEMDFTLWLGPLPVRWLARIEQVSPTGFVDRQIRGPMAAWEHRHTFVPVDDRTTEVVDEVTLAVRRHPLWGPVGLGMALGLPVLFAYRGWRTRRLLERQAVQPTPAEPTQRAPWRSRTGLWMLPAAALLALLVGRHRRKPARPGSSPQAGA